MPGDRFYHTKAWKVLRERALRRDHRFCQQCKREGRLFVAANTVHHKLSREDHPELAYDLDNIESICPACHNKKHPEKAFRRNVRKGELPKPVRVLRM